MKEVKCSYCYDSRCVDDNVIISICYFCQEEMKEVSESGY